MTTMANDSSGNKHVAAAAEANAMTQEAQQQSVPDTPLQA
jgi:hypothetical protein